jgi:hypothetical protein
MHYRAMRVGAGLSCCSLAAIITLVFFIVLQEAELFRIRFGQLLITDTDKVSMNCAPAYWEQSRLVYAHT